MLSTEENQNASPERVSGNDLSPEGAIDASISSEGEDIINRTPEQASITSESPESVSATMGSPVTVSDASESSEGANTTNGSPVGANNTNGSLDEMNEDTTEDVEMNKPILNSDENSITNDTVNNLEPSEAIVDRDTLVVEATDALLQGKHLLSVEDFSSATNVLLSACCKFGKIYGDLADECGDAYFYYGSALLGSIKSCDRKMHIRDKEKDLKTDDTKLEGEDDERTDDKDHGSGCKQDLIKSNKEVDKDEETFLPVDISDSQLAREVLELARIIFSRQNNELKLIRVYFKLAYADILLGNYRSAITNSHNCLTLREKHCSGAEQGIAENLFQLGTACSLFKQFYTALKHFTTAGVILEKKIRRLIRRLEGEWQPHSITAKEVTREIGETRTMLHNIKDKICEVEELIREDMKSDSPSTKSSVGKEIKNGCDSSNNSVVSKPNSQSDVISYLLRRKRKLVINNGNELKKPRLETE